MRHHDINTSKSTITIYTLYIFKHHFAKVIILLAKTSSKFMTEILIKLTAPSSHEHAKDHIFRSV